MIGSIDLDVTQHSAGPPLGYPSPSPMPTSAISVAVIGSPSVVGSPRRPTCTVKTTSAVFVCKHEKIVCSNEQAIALSAR